MIKGWTEAMQLMKEGDKWELYIPSELGYGDSGSPPKSAPPLPAQRHAAGSRERRLWPAAAAAVVPHVGAATWRPQSRAATC